MGGDPLPGGIRGDTPLIESDGPPPGDGGHSSAGDVAGDAAGDTLLSGDEALPPQIVPPDPIILTPEDFSRESTIDVVWAGSRLVYRRNRRGVSVAQLWSVHQDGRDSRRLHDPLSWGTGVSKFAVTVDGVRAVYMAEGDTDGMSELYWVPADGTAAPMKLNPDLSAGGSVLDFTLTPDGRRVIYIARLASGERRELHSVGFDGSPSAWLTETTAWDTASTGVREFLVTSDGARVIYSGLASGAWRIFSDSPTGQNVVQISGLTAQSVTLAPQITADGTTLVFGSAEGSEIRAVGASGGTPLSLGPVTSPTTSLDEIPLRLSPSSTYAAYKTDRNFAGVFELFGADLNTGANALLHPALPSGRSVGSFVLTPGPSSSASDSVAFLSDANIDGRLELFATSMNAGATQRLHGATLADHTVNILLSGPRNHVVFTANLDDATRLDLYAVDLAAPGTPVRLNASSNGGFRRVDFLDDFTVVYVSDEEQAGADELFLVGLDGTGHHRISHALMSGEDVSGFYAKPDGTSVAYTVSGALPSLWRTRDLSLTPPGASPALFVSPAGGPGKLVDYSLDEAASGGGTGTILDGQERLNLALATQNNVSYVFDRGGKGLQWHGLHQGGVAQASIAGSVLQGALAGASHARFEFVLDIDSLGASWSTLFEFDGGLALRIRQDRVCLFSSSTQGLCWLVGLAGRGRTVLQVHYDSRLGDATERARLHLDTLRMPGFASALAPIPRDQNMNVGSHLYLGNRSSGGGSIDGRLFYFAASLDEELAPSSSMNGSDDFTSCAATSTSVICLVLPVLLLWRRRKRSSFRGD